MRQYTTAEEITHLRGPSERQRLGPLGDNNDSRIPGKADPPPHKKIRDGNRSVSANSLKESSHATQPDPTIISEKPRDILEVFWMQQTIRVVNLHFFRCGEIEAEFLRQTLRKGASSQANILVPSSPPLRTTAISVVPPPTSTKMALKSFIPSTSTERATAYGSAAIGEQI